MKPCWVLNNEPFGSRCTALQNTGYYDVRLLRSEQEAEQGLAQGDLLFVVNVPPNFDRSVDRGGNLCHVSHVAAYGDGNTAILDDLCCLFGHEIPVAVGQHHGCAALGERTGRR